MLRIIKSTLPVAFTILFVGAPCVGRSGFDGNEPTVGAVSFAPVAGSWDIQWVSRPSNGLQFADVKRYRVTLTGVNSPGAQSRRLQIRAGDTNIGIMEVNFPGGSAQPTFVYRANAGAQTTPAGAVDLTNGEFWLACTSPNRYLRGNAARTSSTQASVHVRLAWQHSVGTGSQTIRCLP